MTTDAKPEKSADELTPEVNNADTQSVNEETVILRAKCEEYLNGWKRAQADYQNFQKEMAARQKDLARFANEGLLLELLPILDHFTEAFNQVPEANREEPWVQGISYIKKQLETIINDYGVEKVATIGEKFDPEIHEAVGQSDVASSAEVHQVVKEVKAGYKLHGKLIRAAQVIIE